MDKQQQQQQQHSEKDDEEGRKVSSFGITINTKDLATADVNKEDYNGLHALGIAAYEQEDFEKGVINQVNSAVTLAESNFRQHAVEKEVENITDEISLLESEVKHIEEVFAAARAGDVDASRQVSFSLLQKKTSKESRIKLLQCNLQETKQKLLDLKYNKDSSVAENTTREHLIETGEITPFDVVNFKNDSGKQHLLGHDATINQTRKIDNLKNKPTNITGLSLIDRIKTSTQEVTTVVALDVPKNSTRKRRKKLQLLDNEDAMDDDEDEDFVPSQDEPDEDEFEEESEISPQKKLSIKSKNGSKSSKSKRSKQEKIIDDGDFDSFRERLRKHQLKEKLKAEIKRGESLKSDYDIQFSNDEDDEDEDADIEEVTIQDDFTLPKKTWKKLYRYQRVGVKWLWQLHKQQVGGVVGDEMGLGKTIQLIAFLQGLSMQLQRSCNAKGVGPILIVCPGTVLHQWVSEFHKWAPKFRVAVLHDSGSFVGRKSFSALNFAQEALIKTIHNHPAVLVTTYAGVRINQKALLRYQWDYVILDEGHKIRNPYSEVTMSVKKFDTPHRLILTGTPMQNSLKELWSLFDFVFPGRLGTLPVFMAEFSVPITMGGYANATPVQVQTAHRCATVLKDTISPYMLRRMKKDVKMAIDLPTKNEQVLFCKLSDEQKEKYENYIKSAEVTNILQGRMKVFPGLIKLRKICNHPDIVFYNQEEEQQRGGSSAEEETRYGYWKRSGKMVVVESLLRMWKEREHRVLLFSQSKQMLDILEIFLKKRSYKYLRMDGGTNIGSRQTVVNEFTTDMSIFVFLLTTRVGGLGLNLTAADRIIIFDPDWNPSTDTQARERAWRIGQDKHVTIYRLMTTGTIEEKIYHRQIFKQFLTNRVLTNPFQRRFFKSNDLYELFSLDDIGPMQSTETGTIFAGTGSEIRMRSKKKKSPPRVDSDSSKACKPSHNADATVLDNRSNGNSSLGQRDNDKRFLNKKDTKLSKEKNNMKKKKKRRRRKSVEIDGGKVDNVDKIEVFKKDEEEDEQDGDEDGEQKGKSKPSEDDVLMSLFRSSGIHSALRHDKIEQSGNPDYVLVEKEAERVAKQAITALRQSRVQCRANGYSVPTWTGRTAESSSPAPMNRKRFGRRTENEDVVAPILSKRFGRQPNNEADSTNPTGPKIKKEEHTTMTSQPDSRSGGLDLDNESIDISSSSLLARMRCRNAVVVNSSAATSQNSPQSVEGRLLKDIEQFVKSRPGNTASSNELTDRFKDDLKPGQNALFKELLKQLCSLTKNNGVGYWKVKEEFL